MTVQAPVSSALAQRSTSQPLFSAEVSAPEGIVAALEDAGIDLVLGIVAGHTTPIFEALYDSPSIRTIQVRQELVAALAANAYARVTATVAKLPRERPWRGRAE